MSRRNGNRKAQVKRYKTMKKIVPRAPDEKELIDGNFSHYCTGWCERKQAYLTLGLERTHRCKERKCERYYKVL